MDFCHCLYTNSTSGQEFYKLPSKPILSHVQSRRPTRREKHSHTVTPPPKSPIVYVIVRNQGSVVESREISQTVACPHIMDFSCLIPTNFAKTVNEWLREDLHGFDYVGAVLGSNPQQATLFAKSGAVMCGNPFFDMVMKEVGCEVEWLVDEGQFLPGSNTNRIAAAHVTGLARHIMLGERLALNIIGQASGIATRCRKLAQLAQEEGFAGSIAATRKVTPGFRVVQKYAVIVGGCDSHRYVPRLPSVCTADNSSGWTSVPWSC